MSLPKEERARRERARRRHRPDEVRVLFIGESPPVNGTFFYYANSGLYDATREAFKVAIPDLSGTGSFLKDFMRLGCYLDDLSLVPVSHLSLNDPQEKRERRRIRREGIQPLAKRLQGWQPRFIVTVIRDMKDDVSELLSLSGHDNVPRADLPFPVWQYDRYVGELIDLVEDWSRASVLA